MSVTLERVTNMINKPAHNKRFTFGATSRYSNTYNTFYQPFLASLPNTTTARNRKVSNDYHHYANLFEL